MAAVPCSRCLRFFSQNTKNSLKSILSNQLKNNYKHTRHYSLNFDTKRDVFVSKAVDLKGKSNQIFQRKEVQEILKRLTGSNLDIIFKQRKEELDLPQYEVLTDEELKQYDLENQAEAERRLQMPPVMDQRKRISIKVEQNTDLIDMDEDGCGYVFTDISTSKNANTRGVLFRENNTGILREGSWDERDRMEFMYFPKGGQHHEIVPMLLDENIQNVFEMERHADALDLINLQCQPDSPDYIRVHHRIYEDINDNKKFQNLHSTRHFGGLVFYLVTKNKFKNLLTYLIENERTEDAVDLVKLHSIINDYQTKFEGLPMLKQYVKDAKMNSCLTLLQNNEKIAASS